MILKMTQAAVAIAAVSSLGISAALAQCTATISQTEGPYYRTPNPETNNIRIAGDGPLLTLTGRVTDTGCSPLPYAWLSFWHTDPGGVYDNTAPFDRYRGFFFADANGEFTLHTIMPGLYPGRTRHIHVKVDTPNSAVLTTQLYFPGEPQNQTDGIYDVRLEMELTQQQDGSYLGSYDIAIATSGACTLPNVTADPVSINIDSGATANFSITATGGTPMTFQWRKNGLPLANGGRISGANRAALTITDAGCEDYGDYTCDALNTCGSDTSAVARLIIGNLICCPDLNGDHIPDIADLATLLSNFGQTGINREGGDLDGDTDVDINDLTVFLSGFGVAC